MLSGKKKFLAGILSFILVAMSGSQLVNAADNEIQPRGPIAYCSVCKKETSHVIVRTDREFVTYAYDTCIHGKPGMRDKYAVYWVSTVYRCTMCGSDQYIGQHQERIYQGCVK